MILTKDFGFIDLSNMPTEEFNHDNLEYKNIDWARTKDYNHLAKNHCGAVFVTNLALYFASKGYGDLLIDNNKDDTFEGVHRIVGNGPALTVAKKGKEYFYERGYSLEFSRLRSFEDIKDAISKGYPLGVLLTNGIFSWHWIMALGWRQYKAGSSSQENYMRIVDSWNNTADRFYKISTGSRLWSTTKYWINPL